MRLTGYQGPSDPCAHDPSPPPPPGGQQEPPNPVLRCPLPGPPPHLHIQAPSHNAIDVRSSSEVVRDLLPGDCGSAGRVRGLPEVASLGRSPRLSWWQGAGPDLGRKGAASPSLPWTWTSGQTTGHVGGREGLGVHIPLPASDITTFAPVPQCSGTYSLPVEAAQIHSLEDDSLSRKERKPFSLRMMGALPPRGRGGLTFLGRQNRMAVKHDTSVAVYCCRMRGYIFVS